MKIALIADAFPPLRSSCAVLWRDLAIELVKQGHQPTVIIPCALLAKAWSMENMCGVEVLRLKCPKIKDLNYVRRTINEFLMPFWMLYRLRKSPLRNRAWDGIVWYSPTIFFGPLIKALKKSSGAPSYLIIRDIFPDWAVDIGLMSKGLAYQFFNRVAQYQYSIADIIGVQTPGNLNFFSDITCKLEVLHNWLAKAPNVGCNESVLAKIAVFHGRIIFVYTGNMGIAQGMDIFIDLAEKLQHSDDLGFLFVGRGSEVSRLCLDVKSRDLHNILFHDEIEPEEIPGLLEHCHIGLVALAQNHKTHNIPGKFLAYMQAGLPVLASINAGNDLELMITSENVGRVCTDGLLNTLYNAALTIAQDLNTDQKISTRCCELACKQFSATSAARQIVNTFATY